MHRAAARNLLFEQGAHVRGVSRHQKVKLRFNDMQNNKKNYLHHARNIARPGAGLGGAALAAAALAIWHTRAREETEQRVPPQTY